MLLPCSLCNRNNNDISIVFQLINDYVYKIAVGKNKWIDRVFINALCFGFNILGVVLTFLLPKNDDLYLGNIVI